MPAYTQKPTTTKMMPAVVHPTKHSVVEKTCEYIVPEVHPTHTDYVTNHVYKHVHSCPHTESAYENISNQQFVSNNAPVMGAQSNMPVMGAQSNAPVMGAQSNMPIMGAQNNAPVMGAQSNMPVMGAQNNMPNWPVMGAQSGKKKRW
ncbi:spore coat protein [Alkalicoccobacillus porphyridii]|uniref:Spore coat protein n=2 Tax=Alkalicoccobacillus porphyridii TaxID=2597270 RepID=A0A554A0L0_9BACI|nr:spore coat protein [Alkalicoccobacillus porphyridii]